MMTEIIGEIDGAPVRQARIAGGGLSAALMEWGCVMRDLRLDGADRSLILGLPTLADHVALGTEHIGAVAGRCANRIAGGRFAIDGAAHRADRNVDGETTLHGGAGGFGRSLWRLADHRGDQATFSIRHKDGEQGFPGAVEATCRFALADGALTMEMTARTDAPTLCNLAQHNYYNLSGAPRIDDHELTVAAARFTPLDGRQVPTGEIAPLPPALSLAAPRRIGAAAIDLNYVLAETRRPVPAFAARLMGGDTEMVVETTEPGLQVYTADHLPPGAPSPGPRAGVCLEAQAWPDAPNHEGFPSVVLRPGETYRQVTVLRLRRKRLHSSH